MSFPASTLFSSLDPYLFQALFNNNDASPISKSLINGGHPDCTCKKHLQQEEVYSKYTQNYPAGTKNRLGLKMESSHIRAGSILQQQTKPTQILTFFT